jgi:hypothetical protein
MSTLLHSARNLVIASIALLSFFATSRMEAVEKWDRKMVESAIGNAVGRDSALGEVGSWQVRALQPVRTNFAGMPAVYLVPFRVTYSDATNAYCRVAQWEPETKSLMILPVPDSANIDSCSGFGAMAFEDINGDGVPDLVGEVRVHSNRFEGTVGETIVYLSAKDGYCYSLSAAKAFGSDELTGAKRAVALKRLRAMNLRCE